MTEEFQKTLRHDDFTYTTDLCTNLVWMETMIASLCHLQSSKFRYHTGRRGTGRRGGEEGGEEEENRRRRGGEERREGKGEGRRRGGRRGGKERGKGGEEREGEEGRKGGREKSRRRGGRRGGKELEERGDFDFWNTHTHHTCRIQQLHFEIAETLSQLKEMHLKKENSWTLQSYVHSQK